MWKRRRFDMKIALDRAHAQAVTTGGFILGMKQEVDVVASGGKSSAKVGTEGSGADDSERKHKRFFRIFYKIRKRTDFSHLEKTTENVLRFQEVNLYVLVSFLLSTPSDSP